MKPLWRIAGSSPAHATSDARKTLVRPKRVCWNIQKVSRGTTTIKTFDSAMAAEDVFQEG
jgi:hypothetical protein